MKKKSSSWRQYVPGKAQLASKGPVALLGLLGFALVLGTILSLVPALKVLDQDMLALSAAELQVADAQAARMAEQQIARKQLELAHSRTVSKTNLLLTKAQASATLDQLYQLAASAGVRIVTLQNQTSPKAEQTASVDITRFRLHVAGEMPDLLRFVALAKLTITSQAFLLSNVNISQGPQSAAALMDLVLFTSTGSTTQELADSLESTQPGALPLSVPETTPTVGPTPTLGPAPTPGVNPYLVKPHDWPSTWPWPPRSTLPSGAQSTASPKPGYSTYVVQNGDSLSSIASRFGTTVEALMTANALDGYTIYVDQELVVPAS